MLLEKARFVPKKLVSIPGLELTALTLSVKVASLRKKELNLDEVEERFWTDIKIILGYITNGLRKFKTFAANRVQQVNGNTTSGEWCTFQLKKILNLVYGSSWGLNAAQVYSDEL